MIYIIRTPQKDDSKKGKKGNKQKGKGKKTKKGKKNEAENNMRSGRRPSPEGSRLLFAGTVSSMLCPGDRPTQGHDKTRQ